MSGIHFLNFSIDFASGNIYTKSNQITMTYTNRLILFLFMTAVVTLLGKAMGISAEIVTPVSLLIPIATFVILDHSTQ